MKLGPTLLGLHCRQPSNKENTAEIKRNLWSTFGSAVEKMSSFFKLFDKNSNPILAQIQYDLKQLSQHLCDISYGESFQVSKEEKEQMNQIFCSQEKQIQEMEQILKQNTQSPKSIEHPNNDQTNPNEFT